VRFPVSLFVPFCPLETHNPTHLLNIIPSPNVNNDLVTTRQSAGNVETRRQRHEQRGALLLPRHALGDGAGAFCEFRLRGAELAEGGVEMFEFFLAWMSSAWRDGVDWIGLILFMAI